MRQISAELRFTGHPVSPGIGIGPVAVAAEPDLVIEHRSIAPDEVEAEAARLEEALARSRHQLAKLRGRLVGLPEASQAEIAPLIDAYVHMLGNSRLVRGARTRVQGLDGAESAIHAEAEAQAAAILALTGTDRIGRLRRAEEVREIGRRVLRNLMRQPFRSFAGLTSGAVLAAEALRPADAALIQPTRFAGIITAEGGADGHTAVMLRALGLPAVLGATGVLAALTPGELCIIDGDAGEIVLRPTEESLSAARHKLDAHTRRRQMLQAGERAPAASAGGHPRRCDHRADRQPGAALRAADDRTMRRAWHRPAAQRIHVHGRRTSARRGPPDEHLRGDRCGDGGRAGDHPRAGLGL
jgi:phosphoenolpyruvate-protein kinase (PTS system EI component)